MCCCTAVRKSSRPSTVILAAAVLVAQGIAATSVAAEPEPGSGAYHLVLDKSLAGGEPLNVELRTRDGKIKWAWGTTPTKDNMIHEVDVSGLKLEGAKLSGRLTATVWHMPHEYTINATVQGADVSGTYQGSCGATDGAELGGPLSGEIEAPAVSAGPIRYELDLGKVVAGGGNQHRQTYLNFTIRDGKIEDARIWPEAGESFWRGTIQRCDLKFTGERLSGAITATVDWSKAMVKTGTYTFALDGKCVGSAATGNLKTRLNGRNLPGDTRFVGRIKRADATKATAENAAFVLNLEKAVDGAAELDVYFERRDDKSRPGMAIAPNYRLGPHGVDTSGLKVAGGVIEGQIVVNVNPAGWTQNSRQPAACVYKLHARLEDGKITGDYQGRYVQRELAGGLAGSVRTWRDVQQENALAAGRDWPCWRGPQSNGVAVSCGRPLVDSLAHARPLWRSEERTPDAWIWSRSVSPGVSGGFASPIVAEGRVYLFYYLPSGTIFAEGDVRKSREPAKVKLRVAADEVFLCTDAATGETVWKTVVPEKGLNYNYGPGGPFMTPCFASGRLYAIGTIGVVYCLDAATGRLVWQSGLGAETDRFARMRTECLETPGLAKCSMDFCSAPMVIDGVVVCNDNREGLVGLDAETGKQLWGPVPECINKASSPVRWTHQDKNYVIAASYKAVCVEPKSGRVVWEVTGVANAGTPGVSENYMVLGGASSNCNQRAKRTAGMMCYRIDLNGATKAWALDSEFCNHVTSPIIQDGHVYGFSSDDTVCLKVETGEVVGEAPFPSTRSCSSLTAVDGRILREHLYQRLYWHNADPKTFAQLGDPWHPPSHAENTTSTIADGRLFIRGKDGIYCYDLRHTE
ncbi:MAG: PQQ-binding-like beta-propeller repeat protein [Thermoguttaceae bacterium]|jgi:outer membrane protein assembly factor BamB